MKQTSVRAKSLRLFRTRNVKSQKQRRLDEWNSDELLDDWMASAPAVELSSG